MEPLSKSATLKALESQLYDWARERVDIKSPAEVYQKRQEALEARRQAALQVLQSQDASPEEKSSQCDLLYQCGAEGEALKREYAADGEAAEAVYEQKMGDEILALFNEMFETVGTALQVVQREGIWQASWEDDPAGDARLPTLQDSTLGQTTRDSSIHSGPLISRDSSSCSFASLSKTSTAEDSASSQTTRDSSTPSQGLISSDSSSFSITPLPTPTTADSESPSSQPPASDKKRASQHPPDAATHKRRRTESSANPDKTITFDEVFQNGEAEHKYTIVQFPAGTEDWYILRCDEHDLNFSSTNPISGAGKHLRLKSHNLPGLNSVAIQTLGIRVLDCSAERAEENNAVVREAVKNGQARRTRPSRQANVPSQMGTDIDETDEAVIFAGMEELVLNKAPLVRSHTRGCAGITDPKPGKIYTVYNIRSSIRAALLLPMGDFTEVGISSSFRDSDLLSSIPEGVVYDSEAENISGWKEGYEDDGPKAQLKCFPILFIDRPEAPYGSNFAWVAAKDLEEFNPETFSSPYGTMVEEVQRTRICSDMNRRHKVCGSPVAQRNAEVPKQAAWHHRPDPVAVNEGRSTTANVEVVDLTTLSDDDSVVELSDDGADCPPGDQPGKTTQVSTLTALRAVLATDSGGLAAKKTR